MKILVSVFNNLYTDQRVEKFCKTLHENAYQIEVIGNNWGGNPEMKRPYPFSRISLQSKKLRFAYLEFQWKLFFELLKKASAIIGPSSCTSHRYSITLHRITCTSTT
jgi:hypothetical protein